MHKALDFANIYIQFNVQLGFEFFVFRERVKIFKCNFLYYVLLVLYIVHRFYGIVFAIRDYQIDLVDVANRDHKALQLWIERVRI